MSRPEPEDSRRQQLIEATIDTLADHGFAATTLAGIGARAGVSPGLIAHYFADKDGLLEATLRSLARGLAASLAGRLGGAAGARGRVQAVIDTMLAPEEFAPRTCSVWLAFWGEVPHSARLLRVQRVYQGRMLSNLRHALRQMVPDTDAERIARGLAAMIDGLWLRATLAVPQETDSATARAMASNFVDAEIARCGPRVVVPAASSSSSPRVIHNLVGGVPVRSARTVEVFNPATGGLQARVSAAGPDELAQAIEAARGSQPSWAALPALVRARALVRFSEGMLARAEDLVFLAARTMGTPVRLAQAHVSRAADDVLALAAWAMRQGPSGAVAQWPRPVTQCAPLGVLAALGGPGGDIGSLARPLAAALGAGNGVVLQPAMHQSAAALMLAEIAADTGVPAGLLSVLHGEAETQHALVAHAGLGGVLRDREGPRGVIVLNDADVAGAVHSLRASRAGARVFLHAAIAEAFAMALADALAAQRMGDPSEPETMLGPLPSAVARDAFRAGVEAMLAAGGRAVAGRAPLAAVLPGQGFFVAPSVVFVDALAHVTVPAGPAFVLSAVPDDAAAVAHANAARLPLVDVFTQDTARGWQVVGALRSVASALNGRSRFPLQALVEASIQRRNVYAAASEIDE
jgi:betaine-aldehyde dehydrogenase